MLKKVLNTLAIMLVLLQTATGQTTFNSLEEIWKYADAHNITIRNANYELDKTLSARKQSYLAYLPSVNANSSFTENTNLQTTLLPKIIIDKTAKPGDVIPVQFGQKFIYQAGVTAQMDLLNLQTWFNVKIAEETEQLNKATLENTKKTIYQQLASQYYSYLLMKEAARLAERSLSITDSVYQSVQHKFDEGSVNASNVDLAKINKARAEQTLITSQYQSANALNSLKGLLDLSLTDSISIVAPLGIAGIINDNGVFAEDPAIKQAYYQTKIAMSKVKATNASFAPTISIAYNDATQQSDNTYQPFSNGHTWYPSSYWQVKATWNIFTGGTRWLQSKQNKISYYENQMQYESMIKQSAINDDNLVLNYKKTQALLEKSESIMKLSFDNYTHVAERYESGIATLDDKLNAYSDYINYQNQYLNSLSDALVQMYLLKIRLK